MTRLHLWRLSEGLTQIEAARRLGISHLTLGYLETGRLAPGPRDLDRLRRTFGEQVDRMFEVISHDLEGVKP